MDNMRPREQEVMRMRAKGLTEREIAHALSLSYHTVRTYARRARVRTGKTSIELAVAVEIARMKA